MNCGPHRYASTGLLQRQLVINLLEHWLEETDSIFESADLEEVYMGKVQGNQGAEETIFKKSIPKMRLLYNLYFSKKRLDLECSPFNICVPYKNAKV